MKLRPYQVDADQAVEREFDNGRRSTLLVLPTGCGKTVVFAERIRRVVESGGRALVLAHRTELLTQAQAKLRAVGVWAEFEKAKLRAGLAPVVVASVQTLKGARLESFDPDAFTDIVVDEAHHAAAKGYRAILDHFGRARVLGVTATPDRLDGVGLGQVFESCAFTYELKQAIADGFLVPLRAKRVDVEGVDLSAVHTRAGDLAQNELAAVMNEEQALHGVAVPLLEQAENRKTIVFAVDVAHAHALAEVLNRYEPDVARAVDGTAKSEERDQVLADFRAGAFRVLVNCALFTEGFDEPEIACVAIARPTQSRALYTQMVGRGTRLSPETGKRDCLVLDFSGNSGRHRLVGPVDVLAGKDIEDDEVREEVQRRLGEDQLELEGVLEAVEADVERRRQERKFTATARYVACEIDPFLSGGELEAEIIGMRRDGRTDDPATASQLEILARKGLDKVPPELSRAEAQAIIRKLKDRQDLGLCTLKQCRLLVNLGMRPEDARAMPFFHASKRIDELLAERKQRKMMAAGGTW